MSHRKYWLVGVLLGVAAAPFAWRYLGPNSTGVELHDKQSTTQDMEQPTRVIEWIPADVVETPHSYTVKLSNEEMNDLITLIEQAKQDGLTMQQRYELLREKGYTQ